MKRVAMVVSTVGYHWEEVFGGYWGLIDGGCAVDVHTVNGSRAHADPLSLKPTGPASLMGLGMPARIAPETERGRQLLAVLDKATSIANLDPEALDALYLPGGHGCLFDVNRNAELHRIIERLYDRGALLGGVCHATSTFGYVTKNGRSIVAGHAMTGFPNALDQTLIPLGLVRKEFLPLPLINDEELRRAGADLSHVAAMKAYLNPRYMRVSLPFITGVGPKAAGRVARALVRAMVTQVARPRADAVAGAGRVRGDVTGALEAGR